MLRGTGPSRRGRRTGRTTSPGRSSPWWRDGLQPDLRRSLPCFWGFVVPVAQCAGLGGRNASGGTYQTPAFWGAHANTFGTGALVGDGGYLSVSAGASGWSTRWRLTPHPCAPGPQAGNPRAGVLRHSRGDRALGVPVPLGWLGDRTVDAFAPWGPSSGVGTRVAPVGDGGGAVFAYLGCASLAVALAPVDPGFGEGVREADERFRSLGVFR